MSKAYTLGVWSWPKAIAWAAGIAAAAVLVAWGVGWWVKG